MDTGTIVLSGIGTELSDGMLMNMYRTYGPILRVSHNGTNSAHVIFEQRLHAQKAAEATNGAVVFGKRLKVAVQRSFKSTEPCRGFAAGICRYGDLCKYYHVTDDAAFAPPVPPAVKAQREPKQKKTPKPKPAPLPVSAAATAEAEGVPAKQLCRHFTRGFCSQGSACTFAHVLGVSKDAAPAPTGKVAQLCQFDLSGVCTRGDACRFIHQPKENVLEKASEVENVSESENEADTEQSEATRTCVECEKPGVAVWKCVKCDNSIYCDDCNSAVHRARVMAKHKRSKLPPVPTLPRCGECESKTAIVRCEQCEVPFCTACDSSVHKFKSLRKHTRVKLSGKVEKTKVKTKEVKSELKVEKKEKTQPKVPTPQVKAREPVSYVESVPQLELSSDSDSSEDEEMPEVSPAQPNTAQASSLPVDNDEPMTNASETDSEEDFDDVKPSSSTPVTPTPAPAKQEEASESSDSESQDDSDDQPIIKAESLPVSVPKMELSSDSDSSDDEPSEPTPASSETESESEAEAPKPSTKSTPTVHKPALAELSSESESDSDDKPVVKQTKKIVRKPAPKPVSESSSESSSEESEDEAPVPKKKVASDSSSDSSEDEAPPVKPVVKPTPRAAPKPRNQKAGGISEGSSHTLVKKIEAFSESSEADEMHLDANLNGFERLLAHDCAERLGLAHESMGSGLERHIIISRLGKRTAADAGADRKAKKSKRRR
ncbi:hypothetical protein DVH05_007864 [Phytophthora capsici]|nr:hypothetical protein DVH05_007864 [Phytophthora capsici]